MILDDIKDVFLAKIFLRPDCNTDFWKEKFIAGLPILFSEKVWENIREQHGGTIPYSQLTYREIISYINQRRINALYRFKIKI